MIGNYTNKLDDKGRLTIPTKFRDKLKSSIVISYGFDNTLEIRTVNSFDEWSNSLIAKGNLSKNARELQRLILGNSFEVDLDKNGRILLPKQLMELSKIKKEVSLIGVGNKIEIHPSKQWTELTSNVEKMTKSLEELAEELSKAE